MMHRKTEEEYFMQNKIEEIGNGISDYMQEEIKYTQETLKEHL